MLTEQDTVHLDTSMPDNPSYYPSLHKSIAYDQIPMLIHEQLPGKITLNAAVTLLYHGSLTPAQLVAKGGISYMRHLPNKRVIFHGTVPLLQNDPLRFSGASLLWNGHDWQTILASSSKGIAPYYTLDFTGSSAPAGLAYQRATAPSDSPGFQLVPQDSQGPELTFRTLHPLHTLKETSILAPNGPNVFYEYQAVGAFTTNQLNAQISNPLNWLPENTYTVPPIVLRYDSHGHPVSPVSLLPTTNTAGYVIQPPLALTTISAACALVGDNCINAIRVRVAGVITPDQNGWKQVIKVAQEIHQRTGLQVVVTLGSSPSQTLVYVPGTRVGNYNAVQDISPLGWVEERWLQIAVGVTYVNQLEATSLLLLAVVLAVCLGYLLVSFSTLATSQRREFAILSALGWRPWQPTGLFLTQAMVLAVGGGLGGVVIALLIVLMIGAVPLWIAVALALPVLVLMALLSSLYPLWQLWHLQPITILRTGPSVVTSRKSRVALYLESFVPPVMGMAIRNLGRTRSRVLIAMLSLFLSSALLVLMASSLLVFRQTLQGTLLGDFILLQTAVPQVAGCVFAVVLSFLSAADLLLLQVRERRHEIGLLQALGWRPGILRRMFVQEGILLALVSTIPGVLIAQEILMQQHFAQHVSAPVLVDTCAVLLMVLVAALAAIPALRAMRRMQLAQVLSAD